MLQNLKFSEQNQTNFHMIYTGTKSKSNDEFPDNSQVFDQDDSFEILPEFIQDKEEEELKD